MSSDEKLYTGWSKPIDLTDALKGKPLPGPVVCRWKDGDETRALFYPNEVHSVFGEPESMKSWLVLNAASQEIAVGQHVVYIDMEANDRSIVQRLRSLGAETEKVLECFHYFRPDERITEDDQARITRNVRKWHPTLVVFDGVTEAFSLLRLSINAPEDAATWFRQVSRQFQIKKPTRRYPGPAIVELDHVVKARDSRNGWAIGSQHKKAGIKGAAYQIEKSQAFGKGRHGIARVILEKDSAGGVGWVSFSRDRRRLVAELHCESDEDTGQVMAWLESPVASVGVEDEPVVPLAESHEFRLLMEQVWEYVRANPSVSMRSVRTNVTGRNDDIASAVDQLIQEGHLRNEGSRNASKYVTAGRKFQAFRVVPDKAKRSPP